METNDPRFRSRLILCFAIVYVIWGSSYLATAIGVRDLPPLLFGGVRFIIGGIAIVLFARTRGARVTLDRQEWRHLLIMGFLSIVISNGFNVWALQWVPSSQAALLNVSQSFWIVLFGMFGARAHKMERRTLAGLVIGFVGTLLILWPKGGVQVTNIVPQLGILVGCIGWAAGGIYLRNARTQLDLFSFTGLQMLVGGVMLTGAGIAIGELDRWQWTVSGIVSMLYLTVFSSCIAYCAFAWLMQHTSPAKVATYAYVNPAVATLLGWFVLQERLSMAQFSGMLVILAGVVLVNWPRSWRSV